MKSWALAALAAAMTSSSVASSLPNSMFSRIVVANSTGSWLTSPICARSHLSRSRRMSTPSSITSPADGSANTVDFPDPLGPTRATVRPAGTRRLKLAKIGLSGRDGSSPASLAESILGTRRITSWILSAAEIASEKYFTFDSPAPNALCSKKSHHAAVDNGAGDSEDRAALVAVVHDESAAVPEVERRDGHQHGVAGANREALGEPLPEPEPQRLLERGGEPRHGAPLRHERVHGARRRHGLLGDGARARVLLPDPARDADDDAAVDDPGDDEQEHGGQGHECQPPHGRERHGVAAQKRGHVHHKVGHLLGQGVLHDEAVVGHAGDHLGGRAGPEVEVLHVLPEHGT
nr:unnamed protein product [Digitaria exilis]